MQEATGNEIKKYFKDRGVIGNASKKGSKYLSFSTYSTGQIIPNELRKRALMIAHGDNAAVRDMGNISYGNIQSDSIALLNNQWDEFLSMRENKMRKENDTIKITEDVRVPGTDVILEAGDQIEVLKEDATSDVIKRITYSLEKSIRKDMRGSLDIQEVSSMGQILVEDTNSSELFLIEVKPD